MRILTCYLPAVLICLFSSCSDTPPPFEDVDCELVDREVVLEPVCNFDPTIYTTVQFPVVVIIDGERVSQDSYTFSWSSDGDFRGSAISVSYSQLPLVLTLTEAGSECQVMSMLDTDFWD